MKKAMEERFNRMKYILDNTKKPDRFSDEYWNGFKEGSNTMFVVISEMMVNEWNLNMKIGLLKNYLQNVKDEGYYEFWWITC